jgi:hypothetical protein
MTPTYSFSEIKTLVKTLDDSSVFILQDLIEDEKECFSFYELRALHRFLLVKNKSMVANEVNLEFLLSYN